MKRSTPRILTTIATAIVFGIAVAVLKGGEADVRDSLGNISAPWLLLPYFAGATTRGSKRGALMGTAACLAALGAFYATEAFVLDLGGHPVLTNLMLTLGAGRMYFAAGAVCGPALGALGGARLPCRPFISAAVVGLALIGEPLAVFAWLAHMGMSPSDSGMVARYPLLWIGEMLLGLALGGTMLAPVARRQGYPASRRLDAAGKGRGPG